MTGEIAGLFIQRSTATPGAGPARCGRGPRSQAFANDVPVVVLGRSRALGTRAARSLISPRLIPLRSRRGRFPGALFDDKTCPPARPWKSWGFSREGSARLIPRDVPAGPTSRRCVSSSIRLVDSPHKDPLAQHSMLLLRPRPAQRTCRRKGAPAARRRRDPPLWR
jgi:hypothetical protein